MRYAALAVLAIALIVLAPGAPAGDDDGPEAGSSATVVVNKAEATAGHDVWEARFVLLTPAHHPADGLDLRLRHVLGGEAPGAGSRFLTVSAEPDPETLIANLGKLGAIEILDRANVPMTGSGPATYTNGSRIPVPQVESRTQEGQQNSFVRTKYEHIGTKLVLEQHEPDLHASIEASFILAIAEPYGDPVIGTTQWKVSMEIPVGRTAVLRSHYRLPASLLSYEAGGLAVSRPRTEVAGMPEGAKVRGTDLGRVLIVLLTHSRLP